NARYDSFAERGGVVGPVKTRAAALPPSRMAMKDRASIDGRSPMKERLLDYGRRTARRGRETWRTLSHGEIEHRNAEQNDAEDPERRRATDWVDERIHEQIRRREDEQNRRERIERRPIRRRI